MGLCMVPASSKGPSTEGIYAVNHTEALLTAWRAAAFAYGLCRKVRLSRPRSCGRNLRMSSCSCEAQASIDFFFSASTSRLGSSSSFPAVCCCSGTSLIRYVSGLLHRGSLAQKVLNSSPGRNVRYAVPLLPLAVACAEKDTGVTLATRGRQRVGSERRAATSLERAYRSGGARRQGWRATVAKEYAVPPPKEPARNCVPAPGATP